jgi:hypothetical protein
MYPGYDPVQLLSPEELVKYRAGGFWFCDKCEEKIDVNTCDCDAHELCIPCATAQRHERKRRLTINKGAV